MLAVKGLDDEIGTGGAGIGWENRPQPRWQAINCLCSFGRFARHPVHQIDRLDALVESLVQLALGPGGEAAEPAVQLVDQLEQPARHRVPGAGLTGQDQPELAEQLVVVLGRLPVRVERQVQHPDFKQLRPGGVHAPTSSGALRIASGPRHSTGAASEDSGAGEDDSDAEESEAEKAHSRSSWEYEPEAELLLADLIPEYVNISVYRALLESAASELGARMTAMRNAAENAESMMDELTLEMNRVRQAEITQEILEVVGGAEALGSGS